MTDTRNYILTLEGDFHQSNAVARALCDAAFKAVLASLSNRKVEVSSALERPGYIYLHVTDDEAATLRNMHGTCKLHGHTLAWKVKDVVEGFPVNAPKRPSAGIRSIPWPDAKPIPLTSDAEAKAALVARQEQVAARIARLQKYQSELAELSAEITGETRKMLDGSTMIPRTLADKCKTMARKPAAR